MVRLTGSCPRVTSYQRSRHLLAGLPSPQRNALPSAREPGTSASRSWRRARVMTGRPCQPRPAPGSLSLLLAKQAPQARAPGRGWLGSLWFQPRGTKLLGALGDVSVAVGLASRVETLAMGPPGGQPEPAWLGGPPTWAPGAAVLLSPAVRAPVSTGLRPTGVTKKLYSKRRISISAISGTNTQALYSKEVKLIN